LSLHTLGLPENLYAAQTADAHVLPKPSLPPRPRNSHKGLYGHVLVVGGDHGMGGAVRMAGEAALRTGAGLVSVATRGEHLGAMLAARPELMAQAIPEPDALQPLLERASVLAVGAGLGQDAWGRGLWQRVMDAPLPMMLDADGLNLLAAS